MLMLTQMADNIGCEIDCIIYLTPSRHISLICIYFYSAERLMVVRQFEFYHMKRVVSRINIKLRGLKIAKFQLIDCRRCQSIECKLN